jgi:hypothetical protein
LLDLVIAHPQFAVNQEPPYNKQVRGCRGGVSLPNPVIDLEIDKAKLVFIHPALKAGLRGANPLKGLEKMITSHLASSQPL